MFWFLLGFLLLAAVCLFLSYRIFRNSRPKVDLPTKSNLEEILGLEDEYDSRSESK